MGRHGESPALSVLVNQIGLEINALAAVGTLHVNLAAECRASFVSLQQRRWAVIEDARDPASRLFTNIVTFWLVLVFVSFGLQVPRKLLAAIVLAIGVVSISSVMFVIVDLNSPYGGLFGIPSTSMRNVFDGMGR